MQMLADPSDPRRRDARGRLRAWALVATLALLFSVLYYLHGLSIGAPSIWKSVVGGTAAAALWSALAQRMPLSLRMKSFFFFLVILTVQYVANLLEGAFYTTRLRDPATIFGAAIVAVTMSVIQGPAAAAMSPRRFVGKRFAELARAYFAQRPSRSWAWRIALVSLAWLPIYFAFGAMVGPFVVGYYDDPSTGLVVPPVETIVALQLVRGVLYVLAVLALLVATVGSRHVMVLFVWLVLYVPGALIPFFLSGGPLPPAIVPFHVAELLGDTLVYAFVAVTLLYVRAAPATNS